MLTEKEIIGLIIFLVCVTFPLFNFLFLNMAYQKQERKPVNYKLTEQKLSAISRGRK